jgi:hypothetical protein
VEARRESRAAGAGALPVGGALAARIAAHVSGRQLAGRGRPPRGVTAGRCRNRGGHERHHTEYPDRLIPHVGGRRSDLDVHDPALERLVEICSCHGLFEWRLHEALRRGYRVGFVGASDDHTCRPGLAFPSTPEMAVPGGLAGVHAAAPTREAIWDALWARRCYATTGERIVLWLEADGQPMGSELTARRPPRIRAEVAGTAPLDTVALFDRDREVRRLTPNPHRRDPRRLRILWTGARGRDRNRYTTWDGALELSAGRILTAEALNLYAPKYGLTGRDETRLSWRSVTAGQDAGVLLEVDAPDDAELRFTTGPATFAFRLARVRADDLRVDAGGEGQAVRATTLHPEGDVTEVAFDLLEEGLEPGAHAYWLRVEQTNFHLAWSSPVYLDYRPS